MFAGSHCQNPSLILSRDSFAVPQASGIQHPAPEPTSRSLSGPRLGLFKSWQTYQQERALYDCHVTSTNLPQSVPSIWPTPVPPGFAACNASIDTMTVLSNPPDGHTTISNASGMPCNMPLRTEGHQPTLMSSQHQHAIADQNAYSLSLVHSKDTLEPQSPYCQNFISARSPIQDSRQQQLAYHPQ
jgi:hypothetical protein